MRFLNHVTAVLSVIAGVYFFQKLTPPASWVLAALFGLVVCFAFKGLAVPKADNRATEGADMDTGRLLSWLAHHWRHRLRENPLRDHAAPLPSVPERTQLGRAVH